MRSDHGVAWKKNTGVGGMRYDIIPRNVPLGTKEFQLSPAAFRFGTVSFRFLRFQLRIINLRPLPQWSRVEWLKFGSTTQIGRRPLPFFAVGLNQTAVKIRHRQVRG